MSTPYMLGTQRYMLQTEVVDERLSGRWSGLDTGQCLGFLTNRQFHNMTKEQTESAL